MFLSHVTTSSHVHSYGDVQLFAISILCLVALAAILYLSSDDRTRTND